jgi:hypothetical protein
MSTQVRAHRGKAQQLALEDERRVHHDVVEVLPTDIGVIHEDHVACGKTVEVERVDAVLDGHAEVGQEDRQSARVLGDDLALRVDQAHAVVVDLVDHHVVGGAVEHGGHLVAARDQRIAHHLERDRVDGVHPTFTTRCPSWLTLATSPGYSKVTDPYSLVTAGPRTGAPSLRSARTYTGQSTAAAPRSNTTARLVVSATPEVV